MIKFPSINQYRNTVKFAQGRAQFVGHDANGDAVFDKSRPSPKIRYRGTVKMHGTNAGIVLDILSNEITYQSRERVLDVHDDNAGFMNALLPHQDAIHEVLRDLGREHDAQAHVAVFGEWCGGNIGKGVALSGLEKMFVVFAVKVDGAYIDTPTVEYDPARIYSINRFPQYSVEIDFDQPALMQNQLVELTNQVEAECPVGAYFGQKGVGEGIVWTPESLSQYGESEYWFKVKGEAHSVTKVKTLAEVDVEAVKAINDFVEMTVTESRLEQALDNLVREQRKPFELASLGDFIRWVYNDIVKEEADTITASGFDTKKLGSPISNSARRWYINRYNSQS